MKKLVTYFIVTLSICILSLTSVFAYATRSSAEIHKGDWSAQTDPVGASMGAYYHFDIWKTSKAPGNCNAHAGWIGWPYSLEDQKVVAIGEKWITRVDQSKKSRFMGKIFSMYGNNTSGKVEVTKD